MVIAPDTTPASTLRELAQPVIAEAVRRLVAEFNPEQVWLFGSYAWGEPTVDSDLDLLVLVKGSADTSIQKIRQARRCLRSIDMSKDIVMQAQATFDRYRQVSSSLPYKIATEGRLIYG